MLSVALPDVRDEIAALYNTTLEQPVAPEQLHHQIGGDFLLISRDEQGALAGFGCVAQFPGVESGQVKATVVVAPGARGRGLGTAMLHALLARAREMGASTVYGELRDDDPGSLAFFRRFGFDVQMQVYQSRLDLSAFDDTAYAHVVPALEADGFRFFRLKAERSVHNDRKAYETAKETHADIPGSPESQPPFERWCQIVLDSDWFPPEGIIVADDTKQPGIDRFAGIAILEVMPGGEAIYNRFTGTARAYRGRNVGLALKLLAVEAARELGGKYLFTDNNDINTPVVGLNRKLGYVPAVGHYVLKKRLIG